jgi:xanthine dehydrogenase accessory factor
LDLYTTVLDSMHRGETTLLITVTACPDHPELIGSKAVYSERGLLAGNLEAEAAAVAESLIGQVVAGGQSSLVTKAVSKYGETSFFINLLLPRPRLIILGGGHVGGALCKMAALLDYQILLIDDRPSFASSESHPDADRVICDAFDSALDSLEATVSDYIVIVTRGHRYDRLCLEKSLNRSAAYLGMIGSRKRVRAQLEELGKEGYSKEQLARVHAPIGLAIGAVTEPEIALSILAEITAVRRRSSSAETAQVVVLEALAALEHSKQRAALVTIIETFGSTPRKTGSQMIVYPDGKITGTIGGGCSEADARREALLQLDQDRPLLFRQRLTAEAAAEEGMACGGIMDLFIETIPRRE